VRSYVLHLWGLTTALVAATLKQPDQRRELVAAILGGAERSLVQACQHLEADRLCVENLDDSLFDIMLPLLDRHQVGICFDVGHLAWWRASEIDFWEQHRERVREVHLHDARRPSADGLKPFCDHLALGQGEVDYAGILDALRSAGFDGAVIVENNSRSELEESLRRIRATGLPA
jgi:sugar phosphate isomerase/epimerase